jgi:hypothetical protein
MQSSNANNNDVVVVVVIIPAYDLAASCMIALLAVTAASAEVSYNLTTFREWPKAAPTAF